MRKGYFYRLIIVADVALLAVLLSKMPAPLLKSEQVAKEQASSPVLHLRLGPEGYDRPWGEIQKLMQQAAEQYETTRYKSTYPQGDFWLPGEIEEHLRQEQKRLPNQRVQPTAKQRGG